MFFGHYLENTSFVLANFASSDRFNLSLYFLLGTIPKRKSDHPVFVHSVSKLDVFVPFSNRVILGTTALYELVFMSK